ncbi:unnamed protein product [Spirodela intermedia]|uniref:Myb-like domain-containing protein n=1 Tax=Spirodela intermedia TaxID=51605 RepID=A0A7I8JJW3_SPIIN|nr:unnamed protein product [Spirodela intermedia]CAA6669722.1 unnamed protein product [Spirodela intermedia]
MDFVEEESRPRFVLHSRAPPPPPCPPAHAAACVAGAAVLLFGAFYFSIQSQTLVGLLVWISISLLVGPFAPTSITGGDIRVGAGEILEPPEEREEPKKRIPGPRTKARRSEDLASKREDSNGVSAHEKERGSGEAGESEWNEDDFEILKKQIAKHPVGTPRRWELIAEAFQGRHGVESVIREAKALSEKKPGDSFAQFLRQRKPLDKRTDATNPDFPEALSSDKGEPDAADLNGGGAAIWSHGEDIALLNALKAFPKDAPMRWEKVAAAVPGKSKAVCIKRVAELKKDFRSAKAS